MISSDRSMRPDQLESVTFERVRHHLPVLINGHGHIRVTPLNRLFNFRVDRSHCGDEAFLDEVHTFARLMCCNAYHHITLRVTVPPNFANETV